MQEEQAEHMFYPRTTVKDADGIAWAFFAPQTQAKTYPFKFPELQDHEVRLQVLYCGICATDCHLANQEWFQTPYPLVAGHEVIGKILEKGKDVNKFRLGDVVGAGWRRDCCKKCEVCKKGKPQLCNDADDDNYTPVPKFGGFATKMQTSQTFLFPIPTTIPKEFAGPLLCAGVTVFSPLKKFGKAGMNVGVIGIGGLGHLGIKYSAAMGFKTVAITTSQAKEQEAKGFGAEKIVISSSQDSMKENRGTLDLIICTISSFGTSSLDSYLSLLKRNGRFVMVGLPPAKEEIKISFFSIVVNQYQITGSSWGDYSDVRDMLEFSALHKIYPQCQVIKAKDFDQAYELTNQGKAKYRAVIDFTDYVAEQK